MTAIRWGRRAPRVAQFPLRPMREQLLLLGETAVDPFSYAISPPGGTQLAVSSGAYTVYAVVTYTDGTGNPPIWSQGDRNPASADFIARMLVDTAGGSVRFERGNTDGSLITNSRATWGPGVRTIIATRVAGSGPGGSGTDAAAVSGPGTSGLERTNTASLPLVVARKNNTGTSYDDVVTVHAIWTYNLGHTNASMNAFAAYLAREWRSHL